MRGAAARLGSVSLRASAALFAPALGTVGLLALAPILFVPGAVFSAGLGGGYWAYAYVDSPVPLWWVLLGVCLAAGSFGAASAVALHRDRYRLHAVLPRLVVRWTVRLTAAAAALAFAAAGTALALAPGLVDSARTAAAGGDCGAIVGLYALGVPSARGVVEDWLGDEDPSCRFLGAALAFVRDERDGRARRVLAEAIEPLRARFPTEEARRDFGGGPTADLWRYNAGMCVLAAGGHVPVRWPIRGYAPVPGLLHSPGVLLDYWDGIADELRPGGP